MNDSRSASRRGAGPVSSPLPGGRQSVPQVVVIIMSLGYVFRTTHILQEDRWRGREKGWIEIGVFPSPGG